MEYVVDIRKNGRSMKEIDGFHSIVDARRNAYKWAAVAYSNETVNILCKHKDKRLGTVTLLYGIVKVYYDEMIYINLRDSHRGYRLNKDGTLGKELWKKK